MGLRKVRLIPVLELKKIDKYSDESANCDFGNDIVEFFETLPEDRIVEIDDENLYLYGGGNYHSITRDMVEEYL